jgi:hypothetical protein
MSIHERSLPSGDRDEVDAPEASEKPSDFLERVAGGPKPTCGCRERGWVCQHEASAESRIDAIFRGEKDRVKE